MELASDSGEQQSMASLTLSKNIYDWSSEEVKNFLTELDLADFISILEDADGPTLAELNDRDLQELGCTSLLQRKKLLGHTKKLRAVVAYYAESCSKRVATDAKDKDQICAAETDDKILPVTGSIASSFEAPSLIHGREEVQLACRNRVLSPRSSLISAIASGDYAETCSILREGADVNASDALGETPLFEAAYRGNARLTAILLLQSADPSKKSLSGLSVREAAQGYAVKQLISLFLEEEVPDLKDAFDALSEDLRQRIQSHLESVHLKKALQHLRASSRSGS
mmetsp:Transcript_27888/g.44837  ORF Transcript_27888/g.44837 Transcript_27888/m.44837 type:complete len:284 (+) Transcript_27888:61-912(+)